MDRNSKVATVAATATAALLMVLNENDFDQVPATDTADVVATFAVVGATTVWLILRWFASENPGFRLLRAIAAGVAIGACAIGLASVLYDPWAR